MTTTTTTTATRRTKNRGLSWRSGVLWTLFAATLGAEARTFTVFNACPFTIWPAMFTDLTAGTAVPDFPTGWEAPPFTSASFAVPDNWKAARIWGRRDCDFTLPAGEPTCLTGWCNGGLLCDPHTGTGVPPASVAEWTLQGDGNRDFYDVSLVDGYDLPMSITNNVNCPTASCEVDLGPICPQAIQGPFDNTGFPVGCKSACFANIDGDPTNSPNCCSGAFATAATCPSSGVQFYDFFKGNCPNAYAYAFDESSGTALWTCDSGLNADYTLTFCPSTNGAIQIPLQSSAASSPPTSLAGAAVSPSPNANANANATTPLPPPPAIPTAFNSSTPTTPHSNSPSNSSSGPAAEGSTRSPSSSLSGGPVPSAGQQGSGQSSSAAAARGGRGRLRGGVFVWTPSLSAAAAAGWVLVCFSLA